MAAATESTGNLKEALLETLNNILSAESSVRKQAEEHITVLEVTEEFGVHLTELALDRNGSLAIKQLASVLLQQYVEAHWFEGSPKFRVPECPESSKKKIREVLPHGLYEPSRKVRSSLAYAISCIGAWDWDEKWPPFFDLVIDAVKSGDEAGTHGAMRVLTEFSRDVDDCVISKAAPVILPQMYNIFCQEERYSIRTRGRAVEIFMNSASVISMMGEYNKTLAKTLLYPALPPFIEAMLKVLQTNDGPTVDSGLKKEIIRALTVLVTNVPRQMVEYLPDTLSYVWHALTTSAHSYLNTAINAREEANDPTNSDGEVLGFESLVYSLFEFVDALLRHSKHRQMVKQGVPDLLYYLILYMQLTQDQIETFNENADAFVEFEDDESFTYSVRSSASELFRSLQNDLPVEFCSGMVSAIARHIQKADRDRAAGDPVWWKLYESVLFAVSISADTIMKQVFNEPASFDLLNFLEVVVKPSLDPALPPYLAGKALFCGAELSMVLDAGALQSLLHLSATALQSGSHPIIRISAIRSILGLCGVFNGNKATWLRKALSSRAESGAPPPQLFATQHSTEMLSPFFGALVEGLVVTITQSPSEVMALALERLILLMSLESSLSAPYISRVSSLCLAVFIKSSHDPVLVSLVQDLLQELCQHTTHDTALQTKFMPTLVSLLNAPPNKVPSGVHSVALDMMTVLIRKCQSPDKDNLLMNAVFPAVVNRVLHTDDLSTQQNGGECLRAFISVAAPQVVSWRDADGRSGLEYVVEVCNHLLAPSMPDGAATFVGRLVTALIHNVSQHLGDSLHMLLRSVLSKLQSTDTLSVVQNLVVVFAQLINNKLEDVLSFLCSVPGPEGDSALSFVLVSWCSKQHTFYGSYERKVTVLALAKLLEHGILQDDPRLQGITLQGDQIMSTERGPRTRSATMARPEQWTQVPLLVKIFKLIIYELSNVIEANMAKDDSQDEGDDEEEGWEDEPEEDGVDDEDEPVYVSDLLKESNNLGDLVDDDDEEDPDAAADPVSKVELQPYLTNFIRTFAQHPAYSIFVPHLNPHEKEVLTSIGVSFS
uniref:Importin-9-like n=3 Tax=Hirondellea gigas TaxID=1518452 RepID=A0A6A7FW59_9CRUS